MAYTLLGRWVHEVTCCRLGALSALKSVDENNVTHAAFAHGLTIFVLVASLGHIR